MCSISRHPDAYPQNNVFVSDAARAQAGDLRLLAGEYGVNPFVTIEIEPLESGLLYMNLETVGLDAYLYPSTDGGFSSLSGDINITFEKDDSGAVSGLSAGIFGNEVPARKKE